MCQPSIVATDCRHADAYKTSRRALVARILKVSLPHIPAIPNLPDSSKLYCKQTRTTLNEFCRWSVVGNNGIRDQDVWFALKPEMRARSSGHVAFVEPSLIKRVWLLESGTSSGIPFVKQTADRCHCGHIYIGFDEYVLLVESAVLAGPWRDHTPVVLRYAGPDEKLLWLDVAS
jgi:hypothetical protein